FVAGSVWITADPLGRSPLGQGLFGGLSLAGAGLATAAVPLLEGSLGWRSSYVTGVLVTAAALALALSTPPLGRGGAAREATPLRSLLADPLLARLGVMHTASFAFSVVLGNWIVTLLTRTIDVSYGTAGIAGGLTLLLGIVGRPLGGWAVRRFHRRRYELLVASLALAAAAGAALAAGGPLAVAVPAAAALGLASGVPFGAAVAAAAASFPRSPGEAIGAMNLYAVTAIIVGTPLVGATFALPGDGRIGFAAVAALTAASIAAVPRAALLRLP
ncbi:MAG: MFS transporter, partial [Thermoleophilia bacterium]|nr:MFS transporter [Thermoleophilia bacterium]